MAEVIAKLASNPEVDMHHVVVMGRLGPQGADGTAGPGGNLAKLPASGEMAMLRCAWLASHRVSAHVNGGGRGDVE